MVKGVSRRIVIVHAPEQRIFEEAIFILKDEAVQKGLSAEDIVQQACGIATKYFRENQEGKLRKLGVPLLYAGGGAALCGIAWLLTLIW